MGQHGIYQLIVLFSLGFGFCKTATESQLHYDLFSSYNKQVRPRSNTSVPVNVKFTMHKVLLKF